VPSWNGDTSTLAQWIIRVNAIAERSPVIRMELGAIVPERFTDRAQRWYYSLPAATRRIYEASWDDLRDAIGNRFMTRAWVEKTKKQAYRARYRDYLHPTETPSDYFIRKKEMFELVHNISEHELIAEIMSGAPQEWSALLQDHRLNHTSELQDLMAQLEDKLLAMDKSSRNTRSIAWQP
ncbi:hypothetical protein K474DRAFT_1609329, partial [Panus rudis PR-1116 ss-1]